MLFTFFFANSSLFKNDHMRFGSSSFRAILMVQREPKKTKLEICDL